MGGIMVTKLFVATLITEVEVSASNFGDEEPYRQHLTEELTKAARAIRLRSISGHKVLHCAVESVDRK
jgi:hypothetical protein